MACLSIRNVPQYPSRKAYISYGQFSKISERCEKYLLRVFFMIDGLGQIA